MGVNRTVTTPNNRVVTRHDVIIEHHAKRLKGKARRIIIDLDPTDDPTQGVQQLTFYNGHYDSYCYLPLVEILQFNNERINALKGLMLSKYRLCATWRLVRRQTRSIGFKFGE